MKVSPAFCIRPQWTLVFLFSFLGPLGNLLTPHFFPAAFRAYYFLLPLCFLFFFPLKEKSVRILSFFLPFFLYSFVSCVIVSQIGSTDEDQTLFRFFLLLFQFLFVLGASFYLEKTQQVFSLLKVYLKAYLLSQWIGLFFFTGYYLHLVPLSFIERFSVLTQFGFGVLRLSPGSYPNEYGVVSSFALSLLFLIFLKHRLRLFSFSSFSFFLFCTTTALALFLTTTRAAFLSCFTTLLYLFYSVKKEKEKGHNTLKLTVYLSILALSISLITAQLRLGIFRVIKAGFCQRIDQGSLGERYFTWIRSVEQAKDHPFWGTGFASLTNIHNVYLQLAFELGIIGCGVFLFSLLSSFLNPFLVFPPKIVDQDFDFLKKVRNIGLIHVLSFAMSNHNLNHHLTWFVLFICLSSLNLQNKEQMIDSNQAKI